MSFKSLIGILLAVVVVIAVWFLFVDTLMLSDLTGRSAGSIETILVSMFDFDTGLSRYDVYRLRSKAPYWEARMNEFNATTDRHVRETIMAEMVRDPSMKKIVRMLGALGASAALSVLNAI